jgi:hypothetical protein
VNELNHRGFYNTTSLHIWSPYSMDKGSLRFADLGYAAGDYGGIPAEAAQQYKRGNGE